MYIDKKRICNYVKMVWGSMHPFVEFSPSKVEIKHQINQRIHISTILCQKKLCVIVPMIDNK